MTTPDPFAAPTPGTSQPAYGPGYPAQPAAAPGNAPQGGWQNPPKTEVKAQIALALAIAAYTPTIPFIGAIAAIVLSRMARRDILASGGAKTGLGMCSWALWLSILHLVALFALVLIVVFFFAAIPFIANS